MAGDGSPKLVISPNDFTFRDGISYETGESFAEFR